MNYQGQVNEFIVACFGEAMASNKKERNHRFIEEALELVQSTGCSKKEVLMLVDYVFDRPEGFPPQEVGGVMVTLAALCNANNLHMEDCATAELSRARHAIPLIRKKQATKPKIV